MSTDGRTLTWRDLNRALLARQLLSQRVVATVPEALERMGGLQAQYAPSMYVGLWSRVAGFERAELTRLLHEREVVQATLLRVTIHLVSRADFWPFAMGIRQARRDYFLRAHRPKVPTTDYEAAVEKVRAALADGPIRRVDLDALVGTDLRAGVGMFLDLVRVPPSGTWERRRADLFAAADEWLGEPEVTADAGVDLLVRRYLGGFGPATRAEIADWAGLPVATVVRALDRMELRRFRSERGAELVDLPDAPLPDPETPAPVRFLPTWDAALLAHARRTLILPEEHRSKIFNTKMPQSIGTFLVDGQVAGTWAHRDGRVRTEEFGPLPKAARREVDAEADRLTEFYA